MLSIIVPVYNVESYLSRCIDSVLNQTFVDWELILVDDGSTDASGIICDDYAKKDFRIKVVHKENGGQSSARNVGLDIASGEYITFVDSDDYISTDCYRNNMSLLLQDKTIDLLEYPIYIVADKCIKKMLIPGYHAGTHLYRKRDIFLFWSNGGIGVRGFVWQNIYKKELWNSVRFKEGVIFEDCLVQSMILEKVSHVYISGIGSYFYVQREGSTLHAKLDWNKCRDDFDATIPFLHKMVYYGVERKYIVKFYCVTLNRILDKSYLYGINLFLPQIDEINKIQIHLGEIIVANIKAKQKVKLVGAKLLGVSRYLRFTQFILCRQPICF